jgi:hypothetical protein
VTMTELSMIETDMIETDTETRLDRKQARCQAVPDDNWIELNEDPKHTTQFRCYTCDISCNSLAQLNEHCLGRSHLANLGICTETKSLMTKKRKESKRSPRPSKKLHLECKSLRRRCPLCDVHCSSPEQLRAHLVCILNNLFPTLNYIVEWVWGLV